MRNICIVLSLIILFWSFGASAAPKVIATVGTTHVVSLADGVASPLSVGYGVGLFMPLENGWAAYGEIAVGSGFSAFRPAPKVLAGGSYRFNDVLAISCAGMYKYLPGYGNESPMSLVGATVGPVISTKSGPLLLLPVGPAYNISTGTWTMAVIAKVSFPL